MTSDLPTRAAQHRRGEIEGFTAKYGCKALVWFENHDDMESAIVREHRIKRCGDPLDPPVCSWHVPLMPDYTLEFLGRTLLEMRSEMRSQNAGLRADLDALRDENRARFGELEAALNRHQDELTVTTAMVMRHASEPIAWAAMERQIKALAQRMAQVEARLPVAE